MNPEAQTPSSKEETSKTTSGNEADEEPSASTTSGTAAKLEDVKDLLEQPEPRSEQQKMYPPGPSELRQGPVTESEESLSSSTSQSSDDDTSTRRRRRKASIMSLESDKPASPAHHLHHHHHQPHGAKRKAPTTATKAAQRHPVYINVDPNDSPYYPSSSAPARPSVHIPRRIGALGISISSHSEDALSFVRRSGSQQDDADDTRGTMSLDDRESGSSNERWDRYRAVSESSYRAIVDDLVKENKHLKSRLRQYEAPVPKDLREQRLLSVQFFDKMPPQKQQEMEGMIARYVAHLAATEVIKPAPQSDYGSQALSKDKALAGPSNSGFEPASFSGTGFGMTVDGSKKTKPTEQVEDETAAEPSLSSDDSDGDKGKEIVQVLEDLFAEAQASATSQTASKDDKAGPAQNGSEQSNEAYLGRMLSQDVSHEGWAYLNLISTMGRLHRFNVTPPFVRAAIRRFSHKLEVSSDGSKIRWNDRHRPVRPQVEFDDGTNSTESGPESAVSSKKSTTNDSSAYTASSRPTKSTAPTSIASGRLSADAQKHGEQPKDAVDVAPASTRRSSNDSESDSSVPPPATASMVFYANGQFWSDLNKQDPSSSEEGPSYPMSSESAGAESDGKETPTSEESVELKVYGVDPGSLSSAPKQNTPRLRHVQSSSVQKRWMPDTDHFEFSCDHYFPARRSIKRELSQSNMNDDRPQKSARSPPNNRVTFPGGIAARRRSAQADHVSRMLPRLRIGKVGIPIWSDDEGIMDDVEMTAGDAYHLDDDPSGAHDVPTDVEVEVGSLANSSQTSLPTPAETPDYLSSLSMGKYEWSPKYGQEEEESERRQLRHKTTDKPMKDAIASATTPAT